MIAYFKRLPLFVAAMAVGLIPASALLGQSARPSAVVTHFKGKPVPRMAVLDRTGKAVHPSDWRGKVVIVNLWATWCVPCRAEMPSLERLAARYPNDVVVIAVSNDADGWSAIDRFWKPEFVHLHPTLAPKPDFAVDVGALGLPYSLIIDRQGREIARILRGTEWDKGELASLIAISVAKD